MNPTFVISFLICYSGKVVCIVTGGNIDVDVLVDILHGVMPLASVGNAHVPSNSDRLETNL